MRNLRKSRKGISPVLSVLMMIAVAVAASLVTYAWVMGYLGFTTARVGKAIQIQSIGNTNGVVVYVQNVGDSPVTLVKGGCVYINGLLVDDNLGASKVLAQGDTATLSTGETASGTIVVRVVTQDGAFTESTKTFP